MGQHSVEVTKSRILQETIHEKEGSHNLLYMKKCNKETTMTGDGL